MITSGSEGGVAKRRGLSALVRVRYALVLNSSAPTVQISWEVGNWFWLVTWLVGKVQLWAGGKMEFHVS